MEGQAEVENGRKLHVVSCNHDEQIEELRHEVEELRLQIALLTGVIVVVTGLAGGIILMG